jgi:hypothetical protein
MKEAGRFVNRMVNLDRVLLKSESASAFYRFHREGRDIIPEGEERQENKGILRARLPPFFGGPGFAVRFPIIEGSEPDFNNTV